MQLEVNIRIPSLYRIIYRYVNRNENPVRGDITLTPDSPTDNIQMGEILFLQTLEPKFATVTSGAVSSFVLNPGRWTISTKVPNIAFLVSVHEWELMCFFKSIPLLAWKYLQKSDCKETTFHESAWYLLSAKVKLCLTGWNVKSCLLSIGFLKLQE